MIMGLRAKSSQEQVFWGLLEPHWQNEGGRGMGVTRRRRIRRRRRRKRRRRRRRRKKRWRRRRRRTRDKKNRKTRKMQDYLDNGCESWWKAGWRCPESRSDSGHKALAAWLNRASRWITQVVVGNETGFVCR